MHALQPIPRTRSQGRWLAAAVTTLAIATPVAAADTQYLNGAFCRVGFDFGAANLASSANYSTNGSVANQHATQSLNLVCPIPRDNVANTDGWLSVEVGHFDKHPMDAIACTAKSASFSDGTLAWEEPGFSSDTAGSSWFTSGMVFDDPDSASFVNGYHFIHCLVPAAFDLGAPSGIAYYRVEEP